MIERNHSMNTYLHKHHIIPRHAGGTDDPANIVELSVEDHAEAHRILYEQHGRWQDYAAWQGLSKQTDRQDMRRLVASLSTQEHSRKRVVDRTHHLLGGANVKKRVEEGTHNFLGGAIQQRNNQRRIKNGTHNLLGSNSNKERLANGTHPSQTKLTCDHCKKTCRRRNT